MRGRQPLVEEMTDRARRVLVLAQEEARLLNHNFIGTEHILLGLIEEGEGVAAQVLGALRITLDTARREVVKLIGPAGSRTTGSPPFTPRAKNVLGLSRREADQLGDRDVHSEHLLLGLLREGEGVGAQVLVGLGADLSGIREQVLRLRADSPAEPQSQARPLGVDEAGPLPRPHFSESRLPAAEPRCTGCDEPLDLGFRSMVATSEDPAETPATRSVAVVYCRLCGTTIAALVS